MNMMTLFRKTLRDARGSMTGIAVLVALMALLDLLIYPSYSEGLQDFEIPDAMSGFLGEATDLSSPEGFITAEFFSWIPLVLIILAVVGGTGAFAGEEGAGTMDLLLAQPIRRWQLAVAKMSALVCAIAIAALAGIAGFALGKVFVDFDLGLGRLSVAVLYMLPVTLLFLALSLWASARLPSRASAAMLITGLVVLSYFVQILGDVAPVLETARKVSPFYWAEPSRVIFGGFDWGRAMPLLGLSVAIAGLAVWDFERRDITAGSREWRLRDLGGALLALLPGRPPRLSQTGPQPD